MISVGGYVASRTRGGKAPRRPQRRLFAQALHGTALAPNAEGSLRVQDADPAGNWPMTFAALGLPKLPPRGYYEVYLTRKGKPFAPCGTFLVKSKDVGVSV